MALDSAVVGDRQAVRLRNLIARDPLAAETLNRVGYPEVATIYPPLAQACFALSYLATRWSWDGLRLLFCSAYLGGAALLVARALRQPGAPTERAATIAVALGWCPLAVKEIGNSAHLDGLLVPFFAALFACAVSTKLSPRRIAVASGVLLGLAVDTKLFPLLLTPLLATWLMRRHGRGRDRRRQICSVTSFSVRLIDPRTSKASFSLAAGGAELGWSRTAYLLDTPCETASFRLPGAT